MNENNETQQNELLALESIFDKRQYIQSTETVGGQLSIMIELPKHFKISYKVSFDKDHEKVKTDSASGCNDAVAVDVDEVTQIISIEHLPPILMNFVLPSSYPSDNPPQITLSCKWLTPHQLSRLCSDLDMLWSEQNFHCEILYEWVQHLTENTLDVLGICSPYQLNVELNNKNDDSRVIQNVESIESLLQYLIDYDLKESEYCFSINYYSCGVCFEEKQGNQCVRFPQCKHVYCSSCMSNYFYVQIKDGSVRSLTCPESKCDTQADPSLVKRLVDKDTYEKYDRFLLQSVLDCMSDVVYCPRCQSPVLKETHESMGICSCCKFVFCTLCKRSYHGCSNCPINNKELLKLREEYLTASKQDQELLEKRYGKKVLKRAVEEFYSEGWLNAFTKQCPSCMTKIEKIDGCNKMTCFKCLKNFCWICNKLISSSDPYSHFNDMKASCYNLLFEGIVMDDVDNSDDEDGWVNLVGRL